jgi:beta-lactamase regulating signal transducer with metallopeptidase domain
MYKNIWNTLWNTFIWLWVVICIIIAFYSLVKRESFFRWYYGPTIEKMIDERCKCK